MNIEAYKDMLTAEEIAALEAEDETSADEAASDIASEQEPPETVDMGDEEAEEAEQADDSENYEEAEEAPAAAAAPVEPEPEPAPAREPLPDVSKIDEQIAAIEEQRKAAFDEYEDGDITRQEYLDRLAEFDQQADPLKVQKAQASQVVEADTTAWNTDARSYLDQHPGLTTDGVLEAYDRAVRYVTADPSNARLSNRQMLEKAHRLLAVQSEGSDLTVPPVTGKAPAPKTQKGKPKAPDADENERLGKAAPTLQSVPQSDLSSGRSDSPMAALQHMVDTGADPMQIEAAFARLTPEQRDAFSSADIDL